MIHTPMSEDEAWVTPVDALWLHTMGWLREHDALELAIRSRLHVETIYAFVGWEHPLALHILLRIARVTCYPHLLARRTP
jgi:hypothetical protein